jgi:hypothetical protein
MKTIFGIIERTMKVDKMSGLESQMKEEIQGLSKSNTTPVDSAYSGYIQWFQKSDQMLEQCVIKDIQLH